MSRGTWNRIKQLKFFYVRNYRTLILLVILSTAISVMLCLAIFYEYIHRPLVTFYATSGVALPVQLTPLDTPNYGTEYLLPPDPEDEDPKVIPN